MRRTKEMRRFLLYSLYAWGMPSVLTTATICVDYFHLLPEDWSPQMIHSNTCWFQRKHRKRNFPLIFAVNIYFFFFILDESRKGRIFYFLLPIGLHIATNSVLFILTAIHCSKVKSEIHRMQTQGDDPQTAKKRFIADKTK